MRIWDGWDTMLMVICEGGGGVGRFLRGKLA